MRQFLRSLETEIGMQFFFPHTIFFFPLKLFFYGTNEIFWLDFYLRWFFFFYFIGWLSVFFFSEKVAPFAVEENESINDATKNNNEKYIRNLSSK